MRPFILLFILIGTSINMNAQRKSGWTFTADPKGDSAKFRINFTPFSFSGGAAYSDLRGALPDQSSFILRHRAAGITAFNFTFQFIFNDRIGFETGFCFPSSSLDEQAIRSGFQNHALGYQTKIADNNNETGYSPFYGGYDFRMLKLGLIGSKLLKRSSIIYFCDYLYNIETWYPSLTVQFTDPATTTSFKREFDFDNIHTFGFVLGTGLRRNVASVSENSRKRRRRARISMEIRAELIYLRASGEGYFKDTDASGVETRSPSSAFNQNLYGINVGFTLGGFDYFWK